VTVVRRFLSDDENGVVENRVRNLNGRTFYDQTSRKGWRKILGAFSFIANVAVLSFKRRRYTPEQRARLW